VIGQTVAQYKILEKLGEGGMGVVFKAHDTKLDRLVALKFLPQYLSSDASEKERFYHEARAASALLHSNVAVIFEVNEHDGRLFLAMEYVQGQTLKKVIEETDHLPVKKVLDIAIQCCDGLIAAHEKGIVHRDIKSDNIMITSKGQVKIMDFGLAKVRGATKLTKAGSTLGTAAYMSPEQAQGEEVDQRSDIFSFGVVLYELCTGKLPFRGEHQAALMYSLINENPQPIARYNENISLDVERIVMKALAKDKDDRYQHADDLLADLRRERKQLEYAQAGYATTRSDTQAVPAAQPKKSYMKFIVAGAALVIIALALIVLQMRRVSTATVSSEPSRKMLAVLPFENLGSPDQEYFADGMTEEVTSRLSGLSGLGVIARSSAMQYKKTTKTIKQIGEELGVSYILQGTIRWESVGGTNRVRVNPQLINVSDGTQMWSQPSEAVLASTFKLQSEIAGQVANALNLTLLQHEKQSLEAKLTDNSEAYDSYLRGSDYVYRSSDERDVRIAEQMFQRAVELDPKFAAAYAKLAGIHADLYWEFYDHSKERLAKSKEAAEKAVQLDPNLPESHGAMGWYYYHGLRDYDNAIREFKIALQSQPNDVLLLLGIASVYRRQGQFEEAAANFMKASEVDPRSGNLLDEAGNTYNLMRRYAEAEQCFDRAINLSPDLADAYADKALMFLLSQGNTAKAREVFNDAAQRKVGEENPYIIRFSLLTFSSSGQYKEALNYLEHLKAGVISSQNYYIPKELVYACLYGYMGDAKKERASYEAARNILERDLQSHPDDTRIMSALGVAYAGLRRKEDAVKLGKRAVELLPVTREALIGTNRLEDLALIYTMVGDGDDAINTLEQLLSIPSWMSPAMVRIDPAWKPLRNHPRFQRLVAASN
jgi:eukaryotic-like serine/threonine-protein kinase